MDVSNHGFQIFLTDFLDTTQNFREIDIIEKVFRNRVFGFWYVRLWVGSWVRARLRPWWVGSWVRASLRIWWVGSWVREWGRLWSRLWLNYIRWTILSFIYGFPNHLSDLLRDEPHSIFRAVAQNMLTLALSFYIIKRASFAVL